MNKVNSKVNDQSDVAAGPKPATGPERLEIPAELMPQLGAGLQRYQAGIEQVRQAEVEMENVRLQVLLAAKVDRPELYQIDVTTAPPGLRRMGVKGQVPSPAVPAGVPTGPTPGNRRRVKRPIDKKETPHASRKR